MISRHPALARYARTVWKEANKLNARERALGGVIGLTSAASTCTRWFMGEKPGLICLLFHNLFRTADEVHSGVADPNEGVILKQFRCWLLNWGETGSDFRRCPCAFLAEDLYAATPVASCCERESGPAP